MNKKKGIIIGVVLFVLAVAVGYALFSDTLTINGTATAKGEFDVGITCQTGLVQEFTPLLDDTSEGGYKNDTCSVTDDKMSFSVELEYPGATRYFTAKITNNGSIDAIFNLETGISESVTVSMDEDYNGTFEEDEIFNNPSNDDLEGAIINAYMNLFDNASPYGFEKSDGTKVTLEDEEMSEFISEDGSSILLKPGNSVYVFFKMQFNSGFGSDLGRNYYNIKTDLTLTFTFTQPAGN